MSVTDSLTSSPPIRVGDDRRHDLDALRAFAMLLGIGLHASLAYFKAPWAVQDSQQNELLGIFFVLVHGFRMPLFFIVSGYFTMMMFRKRGLAAVVKQRAARILLPCALGLLTIIPLTKFVWRQAVLAGQASSTSAAVETLTGAIRARQPSEIERWISDPAQINAPDSELGITPLNWAVLQGDRDLVVRLIENGADVNRGNRDGNRPLHGAAFLGRDDIAAVLLDHGADPKARNQRGELPHKATDADWKTTEFIVKILGLPQPDKDLLEADRAKVRARLLGVADELAVAKGPGQHASTADGRTTSVSWRETYQTWLTSEQFEVSLAGASWQLFMTDVFTHLWFLWFLCWMIAGFAACAGVLQSSWFTRHAWGISLCLIPLTWLPQCVMGTGPIHFGPDTSTGILPQPHLLFYYALFFSFGVLQFDVTRHRAPVGRFWWLHLFVALCLAFPVWIFRMNQPLVADVCQVIYVWEMSFGLMGLFRWLLPRERAWIRYLSDSSYWLYLAHQPLVLALQMWTRDVPVNAFLKFAAVNLVAVIVLLLSYQFCVRSTWIGALLNGKRISRPVPRLDPAPVGG
ncbi:MAG: acyltransferase family protein [Planctomycetes bacterium]|nr:acyltransferase family protein [Planctomycetota bacterium]